MSLLLGMTKHIKYQNQTKTTVQWAAAYVSIEERVYKQPLGSPEGTTEGGVRKTKADQNFSKFEPWEANIFLQQKDNKPPLP